MKRKSRLFSRYVNGYYTHKFKINEFVNSNINLMPKV